MISSRKNRLLVVFSSVFAGGMLMVLFAAVDKQQLVEIAVAFRPLQLLAAFGLFLLSIFLRGLRFQYMIGGSGSYFTWWRIAALHQFLFTVVPFRLGELSFFPLASRLSQGEFKSSLPVLLNSRLYDFLMLALIAVVAVMGLSIPDYALALLTIAAVLFMMAAKIQFIFVVLQWTFQHLHAILKWDVFSNISHQLEEAGAWYVANEKSKIAIVGVTLIIWLAAALGFYFTFRSFSIVLEIYQVLFLFSGMAFIGILGFFSVGSIGVSELGLTGLLMLLGFEAQHALAVGMLTRLTLLGITLVSTAFIEGLNGFKSIGLHSSPRA